jgi:N-methylhydantoinase B
MAGRKDITIRAAVHVNGSDIRVDLGGSSEHVDWGGNVVFNFTYAYVFMAIKSMLDPDMPNNDGSTTPIKLTAPEESVVHCAFPRAVAARMQIGHFMTEIIYRAMAEALPDRVIAASGGTPATMNVFYGRRQEGGPFHSVIIRGGGMGAGAEQDGAYVYIFPANGANTPVEIFENDTPLLIESRELITDSGGPGKMKGGLGRRITIKIPDDDDAPLFPVNLGIQAGRYRYPPEGLFGGKPGSQASLLINGQKGNPYGLTQLKPGDVVTMDAAGGGGYGDPYDRDPVLVKRDVIESYVSPEKAKTEYGVVIDPNRLEIDQDATMTLRKPLKRDA